MTGLISIDPGMMTGVVFGSYSEDGAFKVEDRWQVGGGLQGALVDLESIADSTEIVCEKFSPRPGARSWKLAELEPIRIEGAREAIYGSRIHWRKPEQRKLVGDSLTLTAEFLRQSDYWTMPKDVGHKDANDVNAAMMHAIGYLRDRKHRPTFDMLIEYTEQLTEGLE